MKWVNIITLALLIVGGLNWGLVAFGGYEADLVANLLGGEDSALARFVYALVGVSALWQAIVWFQSLRSGQTRAEAAAHTTDSTRR